MITRVDAAKKLLALAERFNDENIKDEDIQIDEVVDALLQIAEELE